MENSESKYDIWHQKQQEKDELNTPWHQSVITHIDKIEDIENKRVLEIACGRGGLANYLNSLPLPPKEIVACDYSKAAIDIACTRFGSKGDRITWRVENIQALSFEDDSFDTIISCETLDHLPDPATALKELYRVLKPGGKLYLTCPNYFNLFGLWCLYRWCINKPYTEGGQAYVNYALMPSVYRWIRLAGFTINRFHSSDLVLPVRAHFHFFKKQLKSIFKILGLQTFYILLKPR